MPTVELPGVRLSYLLEGPPDAEVLVLSNSLGTDLTSWDALAAGLSRQLRVLRYDTRGHGDTVAEGNAWGIAELAGDVLGLLDALEIRTASFCGLSLGGMTGMWLAAHAPERLDRLVLCCTSAHLPPAQGWRDRAVLVQEQGMAAVVDASLERWFTPGFAVEQPRTLTGIRTGLLAADPVGYAACCEAIAAMDQREDLPTITAPTLVIGGDQDPATPPEHLALLADRIPGAELLMLGARHLAPVERPDAVGAAVLRHLGHRLPGDSYEAGLAVRRAVLGTAHVERATATAGPARQDFQELITRYAWGSVWTRPGLDLRTRSCITVAMLVAVGAWDELAMHLRAAFTNGVSAEELTEVLIQTGIYAGVPAANHAMGVFQGVLDERSTA